MSRGRYQERNSLVRSLVVGTASFALTAVIVAAAGAQGLVPFA